MPELREEVFRANLELADNGLAPLTWGNASGIDRETGLVLIKPSGVAYNLLRPEDLVALALDGKIVEGRLRPSSDAPTHLALYRAWPEIGGVVHTHSIFAVSFAQAGRPIPCLGTTHADFCPGNVPCVRALSKMEVEEDYEANTGKAIIEDYQKAGLKPLEYPGAVLSRHGPFAWGATAGAAAANALILENIARMACLSLDLNPGLGPIPEYIIQKHYRRKHGPDAYYGQKR
ncbi:MAG: L-ribulose-5-phosphate 4-epimerase AraD [Planctomycetota bacterium]|nr:L-ribulose-5-phosphate 4-epimerase AraD [Planctomycetota bacterium]